MILRVEFISKSFGGVEALKKVSFEVEKEHIVGIIGPNGSGKTTLFNVISGIYKPLEGRIEFRGVCLNGMDSWNIARLGIGRTFQNISLFNSMTVAENVLVAQHRITRYLSKSFFSPKLRSLGNEKIYYIMELLGLLEKMNVRVKNLSYGDQRRVEIAGALATNCDLLMLDEPSAGMNTYETRNLIEIIKRIREVEKKTFLIIEHDMEMIMNISEKIIALNFGEKIAEGTPEEIKSNPMVIEAYLGKEE